ncbi:nucleotidyltransferase domain-containing protein [Heliorestis acidaminivorans]|uniref:Nucleotidyltransferase domain-containing protein n=1 Tax=Heliorestis acidaminivorans TaxID=553427 RepID=A0A6I0F1X8_9FIRM|nr:nucleotidyltransferase domain-containing protein [Heliorestis acidaminivorans]KAB2953465.1 nucleotidyltransferase domain-containing protein [Heliorestis acidaminivorans]
MNFGITPRSMALILDALKRKQSIERAVIFGSRSMGNFKQGSDVDIALYGEHVTEEIVQEIHAELNERLPLPYFFDVIHYDTLEHAGLKEQIDRFGEEFYSR